jgi:hypothetical protein
VVVRVFRGGEVKGFSGSAGTGFKGEVAVKRGWRVVCQTCRHTRN